MCMCTHYTYTLHIPTTHTHYTYTLHIYTTHIHYTNTHTHTHRNNAKMSHVNMAPAQG